MEVRGRAWKFGDNIDTDLIIPGQYLTVQDPKELGKHCMEGADRDFASKVKSGDILVAGQNFGCGSSREHAPLALKSCGVGAVIASSFARIFFRNAVNIGLLVLESEEAYRKTKPQDELLIQPELGVIKNLTTGEEFKAAPYPPLVAGIIQAGGLVPYVRMRLQSSEK
ncbi:MAG: 3-isopropylmalate/(R)-2-methylmalate dehydratase small subunit [Bacillota bacterium]|jgi:3-isopropylmalate dehydratase small subunit|nr:3-isopropylmalate/(R)-2-methylmalate dehydratase small subunit [Bacillota bacterium]